MRLHLADRSRQWFLMRTQNKQQTTRYFISDTTVLHFRHNKYRNTNTQIQICTKSILLDIFFRYNCLALSPSISWQADRMTSGWLTPTNTHTHIHPSPSSTANYKYNYNYKEKYTNKQIYK